MTMPYALIIGRAGARRSRERQAPAWLSVPVVRLHTIHDEFSNESQMPADQLDLIPAPWLYRFNHQQRIAIP